jgi:hypothetical protein
MNRNLKLGIFGFGVVGQGLVPCAWRKPKGYQGRDSEDLCERTGAKKEIFPPIISHSTGRKSWRIGKWML